MSEGPVKYLCTYCGADQVLYARLCVWDADTQTMVEYSEHEGHSPFCGKCLRDTDPVGIPVDQAWVQTEFDERVAE